MSADEPYDEFEIDWTPVWPDEDGRLEPIFFEGPQWIEFSEAEPQPAVLEPVATDAALLVEFDEFALLDPEEGGEEPEEPPPPGRQRASAASLAASLGVHLLAVLVLLFWHSAPAEVAGAIPVRLVIEEPSGVPEEKEAGRSVAATVDQTADQAPRADNSAVTPARPPPSPPQVASVTPPAKPHPPPPPPRPPAAPPRPANSAPAAKPVPAPPPAMEAAASPPVRAAPAPLPPRPATPTGSASIAVGREGMASGAATGEGDYFARLEQLTRPYLYMLSPSFLAGRRGRTTLTIVVGDDGKIGRVGVKRSSGYPDIDARIEQMVEAVGHFPPLPQQLRRPGADLDFNLVFPDVLQQ